MSGTEVEGYALGKKDYVADPRTLKLSNFIQPDISVPSSYDTDQFRTPFPSEMWGNDRYGCCVIVTRGNSQLRLERIEQRRTIPISENTVVGFYKSQTGCQSPGDSNDTGLVMLHAMRQWKNEGWKIGTHNYTIHAYGELDPQDHGQLQAGCYLLAGVHFGFALPRAVAGKKDWQFHGEAGPEWRPGSWGGHAVFGHAYSPEGFQVKTWGADCKVNWEFIDRYCDEAWAVVDSPDSWRVRQTIDVTKLEEALHNITPSVNQ